MTSHPDYRPHLLREFCWLRRLICQKSFQAFTDLYLRHHFSVPPSRMHLELFGMLDQMTTDRCGRVAVAAPRGHAKTTLVSLAYVIWCMLYKKESFVLMISSTKEQAVQLLTDIKKELTANSAIQSDFPEICGPLLDLEGEPCGFAQRGLHPRAGLRPRPAWHEARPESA